ncbi:MAG: hypothetical protein AAGB00_04905 [Planctomycetota bacterium]
MPHPLTQRLGELRARRQRGRWWAACGRVAAATLTVALTAMALDYACRSHDVGLRWLAAACVAGVAGYATVRWAAPVWRRPESSPGVAAVVQQRFPQLGSRLASALEFADQAPDDPHAGSTDLRRAVVVETAAEVQRLPLDEVLDPTPARRALAAAGVAVLVGALFALSDPAGFATAAGRLAAPWSERDWPRRNRLIIAEAPTRLARGQTFSVTAVDTRGGMPDDARLVYRSNAGGVERTHEQPLIRDRDRGVAERANVQRSFVFRVVGGDDVTMAWTTVEVVDPPSATIDRITAAPPAYTGIPGGAVGPDLRVLVGTRLRLEAASATAVESASLELRFGDDAERLEAGVSARPEGGAAILVPADAWVAKAATRTTASGPRRSDSPATGAYQLRLATADGVVGVTPPRVLRVAPDPAPAVAWRLPSTDLFVTAGAVAPIEVDVEDNLAIRSVTLVAINASTAGALATDAGAESAGREGASAPSDANDFARVTLYEGPPSPPAKPEGLSSPAETRRVRMEWPLAPLGLSEGDQLLLSVEAGDYRPGVGVTPLTRRVTIISAEELETRIADGAAALARDLERALAQQRSARAGAESVAIDRRSGKPIDRAVADRLATLGYEQREVAEAIADPDRGAARQAEQLLAEIENNRLERPELSAQLRSTASELRRLADEPLPEADRALADARRAAARAAEGAAAEPGETPPAEAVAQSLGEAQSQQDASIASLESIVDSLGRWSDLQRFAREVAELERSQSDLADQTRREAAEAASGGAAPRQREAAQQRLAAAQSELDRRFGRLQQAMRDELAQAGSAEAGSEEAESLADPTTATQPIDDALAESEDRAIGGKIRDAARQLAAGRLGRAGEQQQAAAEDLREMLDLLRDRTTRDPRRLAEQLRDAAERLAELSRQAAEEAAAPPGADSGQADRRERLAGRADRLSRRLQRLDADEAADSTQQGGAEMSQSASQSESNPLRAGQSLERAQRRLAEAQRQLAERREQMDEERIQTALQKLADAIDRYVDQQRRVLEGTVLADEAPADEAREQTGRLAGDQQSLETKLAAAADELSGRAVFELALSTVAEDMRSAAGRLAAADAGKQTQRKEYAALSRLRHIAQVLRPDPNAPPGDSEQPGSQEGQAGDPRGEQPGEPPPIAIAELRMLRLMQLDVNARTRQYEADSAAGVVEGAGRRALAEELASEQTRLAELVQELTERIENMPPPASRPGPGRLDPNTDRL